MTELSDETFARIQALSAEGDELVDDELFEEALGKYWSAWNLLPQPQTEWDAATWLLGAIGDTNLLAGDFSAACDNLTSAMHCPGGPENPFLHMRLGQSYLETGNREKAAEELTRAYAAEGYGIFADENPKYFEFLKDSIEPPPGGWGDE